jgi:hypothetical protein
MNVSQINGSLKSNIFKSMVQVQVRLTRSYGENNAGTYKGSAFFVDEINGLFLTAWHIVQGPCEGYIVSHNHERACRS